MKYLQKTNKLQHTESPACCFKAVTKEQNGRKEEIYKKFDLLGWHEVRRQQRRENWGHEEKRQQKLIRFIDLDVIEVGVAHSKLI